MKNLKIINLIVLVIGLLVITNCKKEECENVPCGGSLTNPKVDLIVLIDGSGSMMSVANAVSAQADSAIQLALGNCPSDLRVEFLSMGRPWGIPTKFLTTHRSYLEALHGTGVSLAVDRNPAYENEQGTNGIEDLSNLYDWRTNACRTIIYISDEELHSITPTGNTAVEDAQTLNAINAAKNNKVTVSAHYFTDQGRGPSILQNYTDLTNNTNGSLYTSPSKTLPSSFYVTNNVFTDLVCDACNSCGVDLTSTNP